MEGRMELGLHWMRGATTEVVIIDEGAAFVGMRSKGSVLYLLSFRWLLSIQYQNKYTYIRGLEQKLLYRTFNLFSYYYI